MNWSSWALEKAEWQPTLFGVPNRADLLKCNPRWPRTKIHVRVHRNHGFEAVASGTSAYAAWNNTEFEWSLGAYDDTLTFALDDPAEAELIWFDCDRVKNSAMRSVGSWLFGRLRALRSMTVNPIIVAVWPLEEVDQTMLSDASVPGTYFADLDCLARRLEGRWLDPRTESISGTRLSNRACLEVARELACCWLPAAILPPRKVIAVDLDGTLYRGVLGEDGPHAIVLTPAHRRLQENLVKRKHEGTLLALVSRNDIRDVEALFESRADFPLRLADFSAIDVSWDERSVALTRIAERLRVGADALIFIDDNPGELATVASTLPVFTVHASPAATDTEIALNHVAGLFQWHETTEDRLRASDLRASALRDAELRGISSEDEYLRSLRVRLGYHVDRRDHLRRIADLVVRTNQFNLSLRRTNEAQIAAKIDERSANVVSIELADRLSESGVIAAVIGARQGETLRIEEVCVSCRALGRRLEDSMLTQAFLLLGGEGSPRTAVFEVRKGDRNEPARRWLARYAGGAITDTTESIEMPFAAIAAKPISPAITMEFAR